MSVTINPYTIKRLVKFAYSLKQDENWVLIKVFEELIREEKKHLTDDLRNAYHAEYRKFYPLIREQCVILETERRKKAILSDINSATARSMVNELSQQGLVHLPKIHAIRADAKGRVEVQFESPHQTINAPLDHLRARLLRRFGNKTQNESVTAKSR